MTNIGTRLKGWTAAGVLCCLLPGAALAGPVKQTVKIAMPSVVEVHALNEDGKPVAGGSGVIVGRSGLIVTNYHVIKGANRARVVLNDGEVLRVTGVREVDADRDFAILQVESGNLAAARLGDSSQVETGDEILAIGAPLGLSKTVTTGIVSRIWRQDHTLIQHTAAISPGNSGGPLVNSLGQVVGINTFLLEKGQSLFFALPINYVKQALANLPRELVSLRDLSASQEALDEKNREKVLKKFLTDNFHRYEDPDGLFQILLPNDWRVQRSVSKNSDGSVTVLFMANDPGAEQARMDGWLSAGIRIRLVLPPKDRQWTEAGRLEWAKQFLANSLAGYQQVSPNTPTGCNWAGRQGVNVTLTGSARAVSQSELASVILLPAEDALIAIEIALPAAEKEAFSLVRTIFEKSFTVGK